MESDKKRENHYRKMAKRWGYLLYKSSAKRWSIENQRGYMIIDVLFNAITAGSRFDLKLDDVAAFFDEAEQRYKNEWTKIFACQSY